MLNVSIKSRLEGRIGRDGKPLVLVNGFLPFQAEGLERVLNPDFDSIYYQWSTGTGKAIAAEGVILQKLQEGFHGVFYVVKPNNLINAQRKLEDHTGLQGTILNGTPARRDRIFAEFDYAIDREHQPILIFNAEKFREDKDVMKLIVEDRRFLVIFDEMPTKYSNRMTALYRSTAEVLYKSFTTLNKGKKNEKRVYYPRAGWSRAEEMYSVALSATPIIASPEGFFNCIRMIAPGLLGTITDFNNKYVGMRDRYGNILTWRNLDHMRDKVNVIVHSADKINQPEIAAQFPPKLPTETIYCDLDVNARFLYDTLQAEYSNIGQVSILGFHEILAAIGCFQMICSNPRGVLKSAIIREAYEADLAEFVKTNPTKREIKEFAKKYREGSAVALKLRQLVGDDSLFTDKDKDGNCINEKMLKLREELEQHDGKSIVFASANETLLPFISEWFDEWGFSHVVYHGGLSSAKKKQEIIDSFRFDPSIKIFLSSDAGGDSIDLPESSLLNDYDMPWTYAQYIQRDRQDRIDSTQEVLERKGYTTQGTVEERAIELVEKRRIWHEQMFGPNAPITDDEIEEQEYKPLDLIYVLSGLTMDEDTV